MFNKYKLSWTIAFFDHKNPIEWKIFKRKYEKEFNYKQSKIINNTYTMWIFDKGRIEWIKQNAPKNCSIKFIQITDKQFEDMEIFYKGENND